MTKRKIYTPAFKAQVALAAPRGDRTVREPAGQHGVHPTLIRHRKRQMHSGAEQVFAAGNKAEAAAPVAGPPDAGRRLPGASAVTNSGVLLRPARPAVPQLSLNWRDDNSLPGPSENAKTPWIPGGFARAAEWAVAREQTVDPVVAGSSPVALAKLSSRRSRTCGCCCFRSHEGRKGFGVFLGTTHGWRCGGVAGDLWGQVWRFGAAPAPRASCTKIAS